MNLRSYDTLHVYGRLALGCGCIVSEGRWYISNRDFDFDDSIWVVKIHEDRLLVQRCSALYPITHTMDFHPYGVPYYVPLDAIWCDCKTG